MKYLLIASLLLLIACDKRTDIATVIGVDGQDGKNGHSLVSQYNKIEANHEESEEVSLECLNGGNRLDIFIDMDDSLTVSEGDVYSNSLVACNGLNGLQGLQGLQGVEGIPGEQGERGPRGIRGERGPQGRQGRQGPQGIAGLNGEDGPQGLQGEPGAIGPQGLQGLQGIAGPAGPQGAQGPQGVQGQQGLQGLPGSNGTNGSSGATITNYGSSQCTRITGTNSYVKPNGSNLGLFTSSNCSSNSKFAEVSQGEAYWVSSNSLGTWYDGCLRVITFN